MSKALGFDVFLNSSYDEAITAVTAELQKEGFGVLTEIDVKATLKKKLDVDFRNPTLAHKALTLVPEVGMLLPCNVTVAQEEDGRIRISIIDPQQMLGVVDHPGLEEIACDAEVRLRRVAAALKQ